MKGLRSANDLKMKKRVKRYRILFWYFVEKLLFLKDFLASEK